MMNQLNKDNVELLDAPFKVAAVNAASISFDVHAGLELADKITKEAVEAGAKLVAFPELWLPGFINGNSVAPPEHFQEYIDNSIEVGSKEWESILEIANNNNVFLCIGFSEKKNNHLYMTQVIVDPNGNVLNKRSKINPSGCERNYFSDTTMEGNLEVISTPLGRMGQLSCGEHFKPMMTFPMMAQVENIHICGFPYNKVDDDNAIWWETYHMNQTCACYYSTVSKCWTIMSSVGRSCIVNNEGKIVAEADNTVSNFAIAEIDPSAFKDTPSYNSTGNFSWGVLKLIESSYKGPHEADTLHESINEVDYTKI